MSQNNNNNNDFKNSKPLSMTQDEAWSIMELAKNKNINTLWNVLSRGRHHYADLCVDPGNQPVEVFQGRVRMMDEILGIFTKAQDILSNNKNG